MADALERSIEALEESLTAAAEARGEAEEYAERMKQVFSILVVSLSERGQGHW
jgi:hypothetical protein